jgi:predicted transcriptional regulator
MNRRTQIYLDDRQTARLDRRAAAEGTSRSMLIRRAIEVFLSQEEQDAAVWQEQWKSALEGTAGAAPHLDEGVAFVDDLRGADAERLSRLAR